MGQRIKELRERVPYSQRELAERVGISNAQLSRIEHGKSKPRPETIRNIAKVLGVSSSWLNSGEGPMRDE